MPKIEPNNATVVHLCTKRLHALETYVPDETTGIDVNGTPHTAASVRAIYQESLDIRAEIRTIRAQLAGALSRRDEAEARRLAADRALKPWVVNKFGDGSAPAHDFGFPPAKVTPMTVEQKVQAVARRRATREARHTMGARQRERIRGTLPGAVEEVE